MKKLDKSIFHKPLVLLVLAAFLMTSLPGFSYAQMQMSEFNLPQTQSLQQNAAPVIISGMTIYPENPLKFDFIVDVGSKDSTQAQPATLKSESQKVINYFFAALTVPEEQMWVNLSPYEKNRIIADGLSVTEMGRDMLEQDYILKQLSASFLNPQEAIGKKFWDRVYKRAQEQYGTTQIPVNTFNKVWIVPENASVYVNGNSVFVTGSHLKVMMEADYFAGLKNDIVRAGSPSPNKGEETSPVRNSNSIGSQIMREIVIPELEKAVNEGKEFATLRQIYNSMILATWFKRELGKSVRAGSPSPQKARVPLQGYINNNKTIGIELEDKSAKEKIYAQYIKAYKKGAFIKEDIDPQTQQVIPRRYFSGGLEGVKKVDNLSAPPAMWLGQQDSRDFAVVSVNADVLGQSDKAMVSSLRQIKVEDILVYQNTSICQVIQKDSTQITVRFFRDGVYEDKKFGEFTITTEGAFTKADSNQIAEYKRQIAGFQQRRKQNEAERQKLLKLVEGAITKNKRGANSLSDLHINPPGEQINESDKNKAIRLFKRLADRDRGIITFRTSTILERKMLLGIITSSIKGSFSDAMDVTWIKYFRTEQGKADLLLALNDQGKLTEQARVGAMEQVMRSTMKLFAVYNRDDLRREVEASYDNLALIIKNILSIVSKSSDLPRQDGDAAMSVQKPDQAMSTDDELWDSQIVEIDEKTFMVPDFIVPILNEIAGAQFMVSQKMPDVEVIIEEIKKKLQEKQGPRTDLKLSNFLKLFESERNTNRFKDLLRKARGSGAIFFTENEVFGSVESLINMAVLRAYFHGLTGISKEEQGFLATLVSMIHYFYPQVYEILKKHDITGGGIGIFQSLVIPGATLSLDEMQKIQWMFNKIYDPSNSRPTVQEIINMFVSNPNVPKEMPDDIKKYCGDRPNENFIKVGLEFFKKYEAVFEQLKEDFFVRMEEVYRRREADKKKVEDFIRELKIAKASNQILKRQLNLTVNDSSVTFAKVDDNKYLLATQYGVNSFDEKLLYDVVRGAPLIAPDKIEYIKYGQVSLLNRKKDGLILSQNKQKSMAHNAFLNSKGEYRQFNEWDALNFVIQNKITLRLGSYSYGLDQEEVVVFDERKEEIQRFKDKDFRRWIILVSHMFIKDFLEDIVEGLKPKIGESGPLYVEFGSNQIQIANALISRSTGQIIGLKDDLVRATLRELPSGISPFPNEFSKLSGRIAFRLAQMGHRFKFVPIGSLPTWEIVLSQDFREDLGGSTDQAMAVSLTPEFVMNIFNSAPALVASNGKRYRLSAKDYVEGKVGIFVVDEESGKESVHPILQVRVNNGQINFVDIKLKYVNFGGRQTTLSIGPKVLAIGLKALPVGTRILTQLRNEPSLQHLAQKYSIDSQGNIRRIKDGKLVVEYKQNASEDTLSLEEVFFNTPMGRLQGTKYGFGGFKMFESDPEKDPKVLSGLAVFKALLKETREAEYFSDEVGLPFFYYEIIKLRNPDQVMEAAKDLDETQKNKSIGRVLDLLRDMTNEGGSVFNNFDDRTLGIILDQIGFKIIPGSHVLEIGAGNGIVTRGLIELTKDVKDVQFTATDINPEAVQRARQNLREYSNVKVLGGDLFSAVPESEKYDYIIWLPPWKSNVNRDLKVTTKELATIDPQHAKLQEFLKDAPAYLSAKGRIYLVLPRFAGERVPKFLRRFTNELNLEVKELASHEVRRRKSTKQFFASLYELKPASSSKLDQAMKTAVGALKIVEIKRKGGIGGQEINNDKDIERIVEEPWQEAVNALMHKGIKTNYSSANLVNLPDGGILSLVGYTVNDDNRRILKEISKDLESKGEGVIRFLESGPIHIVLYFNNQTTVEEFSKRSLQVINQLKDQAMSSQKAPGGIDFNAKDLKISQEGQTDNVKFNFAQLDGAVTEDIKGIVPIIINVTPIPSIYPFIGLAARKEKQLS